MVRWFLYNYKTIQVLFNDNYISLYNKFIYTMYKAIIKHPIYTISTKRLLFYNWLDSRPSSILSPKNTHKISI